MITRTTHVSFDDKCQDNVLKVEIPYFGGDLSGEIFYRFVTIQKIVDLTEVPKSEKVKLVTLKLRGRASTCLDQHVMAKTR